MKKEYSPVFSTITPCSDKYLVTTDAGIPSSLNSPDKFNPGVTIVAFIGSSILKLSWTEPNPCQSSLGLNNHCSLCVMPSLSGSMSFGPHTLNHQFPSPNSLSTFRIARRKSRASIIDSSTNAFPPGGSIIAAATSREAIIEYWGLVEECIRYASLKTLWSKRFVFES